MDTIQNPSDTFAGVRGMEYSCTCRSEILGNAESAKPALNISRSIQIQDRQSKKINAAPPWLLHCDTIKSFTRESLRLGFQCGRGTLVLCAGWLGSRLSKTRNWFGADKAWAKLSSSHSIIELCHISSAHDFRMAQHKAIHASLNALEIGNCGNDWMPCSLDVNCRQEHLGTCRNV